MNETIIKSLLSHRPHFQKLFLACQAEKLATAIICPHDLPSLQSAILAANENLLSPILIGDEKTICNVAQKENLNINKFKIIDTKGEEACAHKGVDLVASGEAKILMKGHIHSDIYLSAVLRRNNGLRTKTRTSHGATARTSHCFVLDIPNWQKPIIITDAALNIAPDVATKIAIIENAIDFARAIGITEPKVALLSAVESPNPSIASSIEAAEIVKSHKFTGGVVDGPFALDNAASLAAAKAKGITSQVAGQADIYVVPNIESGNIFFKALTFMGGSLSAGLVVGAKAPIILNSRADNEASRLSSAILACFYAKFLAKKYLQN